LVRRKRWAGAQRLRLNKAHSESHYKPDGVLLSRTTGGKTELAKAVAEFMFGDDRKMVREHVGI
jgi:ATP-dependent Clp protease ATP-binding subunit ClpA